MEEKNLLLICASGITTGMLVRNIQKHIEDKNLKIHVYSAPAIIARQVINEQQIDGILIGPQSRYEIQRLEDLLSFKKIPYRLISQENYEVLNGAGVLEEGLSILKE
ncbi:PTS sugar transporter subunit IIB [Enterococcus asini]|uniref:PTS sugar transporter subunit IIB n=1 Tax=Enterococcus asini TaxID=57732 RepID=UPI0026DB9CBE|nr:PTS sugar transporter subunit IIB [Enterococcus asini]